MRKIQLKDAKASLSSVVNDAVRGQPAVITRHGRPEAVVLGFREWERFAKVPTFGQVLMSPDRAGDLPRRNRWVDPSHKALNLPCISSTPM